MTEILIASSSMDAPSYAPVAEKLTAKGYNVSVYLADRVVSGEDKLSVSINEGSGLSVTYNEIDLPLTVVEAAWYRHPNLFGINKDDKASQMCLEQEIGDLQNSLWALVSDEAWLNNPNRMKEAQAKLAQLALAQELGFSVPKTAAGNNWRDIDASLGSGEVVAKMSRGLLHTTDSTRVVYTTKLSQEQRISLRSLSPFPAIYQEYKNKDREWRVTVVGDQIFPAAIYTAKEAKVDWRIHQLTEKVEFKKEPLRDDISELCLSYLSHFGLTYGAFDFIEDGSGKITFLECNTNGQYRWLEDLLDLPISDAIVDNLVRRIRT